MAGDPLKESVDDLVPRSAVNEVKSTSSEPESVTIQRLKNERTAYVLIVLLASTFFFALAVFLMLVYFDEGTDTDAKSRIIFGLIAAMSAALGVVAGKKL